MSLGLGLAFALALHSAFQSHKPDDLDCWVKDGLLEDNNSYIQVELLDQEPFEPIFNSRMYLSLSQAHRKDPERITFETSPTRTFAGVAFHADLLYREDTHTLVPDKTLDFYIVRTKGSHRDFPFDSAEFDFDLSHSPPVPIGRYAVRNLNHSFDVPCATMKVETRAPGREHLHFEATRNRVVQLTAVLLLGAGFLFLIGIVTFVKSESLPTAIASYFFSMWSIRSILSSEIKTFPTDLDLGILSLCALLLVALGIRLSLKELRALSSVGEA